MTDAPAPVRIVAIASTIRVAPVPGAFNLLAINPNRTQ
jgi:hypothetical protein